MPRDYRKLRAFQSADSIAKDIYKVTKLFPNDEKYGLISQLRRAAVSTPTNIVEGSHRESLPEYIRFLNIAVGSMAETRYLTEFSASLDYIDSATGEDLKTRMDESIRLLIALIESLRKKL